MSENLFGDTRWRRPEPEPVADESPGLTPTEAVTDFVAAGEALLHAEAEALQRKWWWSRRRKSTIADGHQSADRMFRRAYEGISGAHVGSVPGVWGLLSSDIESTIERYLRGHVGEELRDRLRAIEPRLFEARIRAHEGDRTLEGELPQELVRCVELEPANVRARRLIHHLPSRERRIPDVDLATVAEELDAGVHPPFDERYFHYRDVVNSLSHPRFPLATIWVSFWSMQELKLHDIVAEAGDTGRRRERRRRPVGLGTAVLEHLYRSADQHGLAIFGEIMPGDSTEESSERLARWYARHGFTIKQKSSEVYMWAKIRREPQSGSS
ncbi:hypothetical protein [Mycobacteroides abscessus]|uniref:hypothetical protein n=1 Tax=Mycobacteroides abscessus TaxID=36809 RepID=UPI0005DC4508|nr:hypothetical protein [Mycobacteroides abscessus]CPW93467.1 Uncharacterised protein [Mycobacteroides abscessus]SKF62032.1 Uncharacterised protein [Mycobacteroides abscessus subsp. bolletii]SKH91262.1 Uncharacterised protein [Mycobacteroides abscessus subsp. bolletii]